MRRKRVAIYGCRHGAGIAVLQGLTFAVRVWGYARSIVVCPRFPLCVWFPTYAPSYQRSASHYEKE